MDTSTCSNTNTFAAAESPEPTASDLPPAGLSVYREQDILRWATERGILQFGSIIGQASKAAEEMTELLTAVAQLDMVNRQIPVATWFTEKIRNEVGDAIGDVFVCLVNLSEMCGLSMTQCIDQAWNEIKDRKGQMKADGKFHKE